VATVPDEQGLKTRFEQFNQLSSQKKIGFMLAAAAIIALLAGAWMWSQTPDYRVLYANISDDRDGGVIINALQQMNVPYKFDRGGSTIMVPGNRVHEVRLQLASQGLPKGGLASFELMENQKFGSSQFLEQVNYQRALEGELARSIQSISAVQSARVHLAISRPSVFARERKQPRASVLINLLPGRLMSIDQVSAIVHLVSSSVPNLPVMNITVVDQDGNLLSSHNENKSETGLDAGQLEYIRAVEESYTKRIEAILTPIAGSGNVRAQVTADVDFSRVERAEEIYRPNNTESEPASIRSQQNVESITTGSQFEGGIPGALSNRPPEPAIAPIELEEGQVADTPPTEKPTDRRIESTINYEVDKTVQHTHQPIGGIKRLSAAVVVNYRAITASDGTVSFEPLSTEEITDIRNLVREAMGYNEVRGDTLAVTNSLFNGETSTDNPLWKDPDMLMLTKEIGKQLLIAVIVLFFLLKVLRPFLKSLAPPAPVPSLPNNTETGNETSKQNALRENGTQALNTQLDDETLALEQSASQAKKQEIFKHNLQKAKQLAMDEPVIVANVVKEWVTSNGG
jgi:flagellar M-ring protein FliF